MAKTVIVRYGEIALKSEPVRRRFERRLIENIKLSLKGLDYKLRRERGRIFTDTCRPSAVMERLGVFDLADEMELETLVFDELEIDDWVTFPGDGTHWSRGFALPRQVLEADSVVQTCCLKTHRYGGHFTLSLKNSVGLAAKWLPGDDYNYMSELHGSPFQRQMIAEINAAYQADLVVLDGVLAFVEGGPAAGKIAEANVILAGTDRVAIDAVGVALLRYYGTTREVQRGVIFEQEQIARAVELGLGVSRPDLIELLTDDAESAIYAAEIQQILIQS